MKAGIIYFSGTGNTEFIAYRFKREFEERKIECTLIDVRKRKKLKDDFNFFVVGGPIHAEMLPEFLINWVKDNIPFGDGRRCIVFSTQAADYAAGVTEVENILMKKGFVVTVKKCIKMPNNYYLSFFKKTSKNEFEKLKNDGIKEVIEIVENFLNNKKNSIKASKGRLILGKAVYKAFLLYSWGWAKRNLSIDNNTCVRCGKCVKNCPTKNISMGDSITFKKRCISCQRCINCCPVNAFLYKGKSIEQYKL